MKVYKGFRQSEKFDGRASDLIQKRKKEKGKAMDKLIKYVPVHWFIAVVIIVSSKKIYLESI